MPWQNQGGPWGGGGGGTGGGSGGGAGGGGQSPWGGRGGGGGGNRPPEFEDLFRKGQDRMKRWLPGGAGGKRSIAFLVIIGVVLWLLTGFFQVQADEVGLKKVFGRYWSQVGPGLNYNFPAPIGAVEKPKVTRRNTVEIGFQSTAGSNRTTGVDSESLMLTGDENIIDIQLVVIWFIKDPQLYAFNVRDPEATVKNASEAAVREIVGQTPFELARTQGRADLEARTRQLIQSILDNYKSGIDVELVQLQRIDPPDAVISAFRDVQAARADKESSINEANAYYNTVTQTAEGAAQRIRREAEAYREEKVAIATGESQRFLAVLKQYRNEKDVTTRRLYLETMENIFKNMTKVIVDPSAGAASGGTVPYISLNELLRANEAARRQAPDTSTGGTAQ